MLPLKFLVFQTTNREPDPAPTFFFRPLVGRAGQSALLDRLDGLDAAPWPTVSSKCGSPPSPAL